MQLKAIQPIRVPTSSAKIRQAIEIGTFWAASKSVRRSLRSKEDMDRMIRSVLANQMCSGWLTNRLQDLLQLNSQR